MKTSLGSLVLFILDSLICVWMPLVAGALQAQGVKPQPAATKVELRKQDDRWRLYVNYQPFYIKGAGLESGDPQKLAAHGGNSFRTWHTGGGPMTGRQILDSAWTNGLYVTLGLDIARERHGFDYNDPVAVARQLARIKTEVLKYKDHPALIIWAIGNELNLNATNPGVWDAVNGISKMIHRLDTNHLTCTCVAGLKKELVQQLRARAPDLDIIGIQMYADIVNLPRYIVETGLDRPYIVTEWGATGHWEVAKTQWGSPIENDSTTKADYYLKRFQTAIAGDQRLCLGSYVFLWGQKQERTPTWYGMFLASGEETATVDALHYIWTGQWPANLSPRIQGAWLDGKTARQNIHLKAGQTCPAKVVVVDADGDTLSYRWEVMEESAASTTGGDAESIPNVVPGLIEAGRAGNVVLTAPAGSGAYRLFAYAMDGKGHAAHVNIPFYVDK
jgi:hypothetical protein